MCDLDDEWENFLTNQDDTSQQQNNSEPRSLVSYSENNENISENIPECSKIKISTKTKIIYLNQNINLNDLFWKLDLINYMDLNEGILKKQIKYNFNSKEEIDEVEEKLKNEKNVNVQIIRQINNPTGRVRFKDIRKITIGLTKSDITAKKVKEKSAFYNCFVVILRVFLDPNYKEIHVKVFNTGKLEIPGIKDDIMLEKIINLFIKIIQPFYEKDIYNIKEKNETVLINSNFTCNYFINREKLFNILKYKYQIKSNYDSCSYPGILCRKFKHKEYTLSFMIFRTGSVLIVGKCEIDIIEEVYDYLKQIFRDEYHEISIQDHNDTLKNKKIENDKKLKTMNKKKKKKIIYITEN
tara:strand:- start:4904 stop:5965 length:1062 start_codon:yes stop_codon:yes gene_type:complete